MTAPAPAFLRPDEAAHYCGVSRRWLAKLVAAGQLPVIRPSQRLTLFARSDLEATLLRFRRGAVAGARTNRPFPAV